MELFAAAVALLACFAVFDLIVGVSNDAVNFLNSSIGSRVVSRRFIMIVASLGLLAGVTFSSGMMEVARKGIFHPQFFTMPDLLFIFLSVMLTDIILLDLFNTYGLPTSTTVSIVFELLGAAVAVSILKIIRAQDDMTTLAEYINTSKALMIIFGILLSIVVAFVLGAVVQFLSRLLFTFEYMKRIARYGALWGGVALASITYFILIKGAKGSAIISPEVAEWFMENALILFLIIFPVSAAILQVLLWLKVNIFKPIILIGTFALAMSFAANDLVNFIGVPMAGLHAFRAASASETPLTATMDALAAKVPAETYLLLLAGFIMVVTLWLSRKARTVTETEISLGRQEEAEERFESSFVSRFIVRVMRNAFGSMEWFVPGVVRSWVDRRLDTSRYYVGGDEIQKPRFDLLRASVNMMVASAVISYATSHTLPLSTTYVTFMVAMGTSFADRAWGRESAVYRVAGVLTVVGGWFMTAIMAFSISALFALVIYHARGYGVILLLILGGFIIWKNHHKHAERARSYEMEEVFNLRKVSDLSETLYTTFEHMAHLIREVRVSLGAALEALFAQNEMLLKKEKAKTKKIQRWANIITANIFKSMRLEQKEEMDVSYMYGQAARRIQKLVDGHRDIVMRAYLHVSNHHKGLLPVQEKELRQVMHILDEILAKVELIICRKEKNHVGEIEGLDAELRELARRFHEQQLRRIRDNSSKTRLSILFYSIVGNCMNLSKQNLKLLEIFEESFGRVGKPAGFDMD
jgi:phosphate/sulfate permease